MIRSKALCSDRCKTFPLDSELSTLRVVAGPLGSTPRVRARRRGRDGPGRREVSAFIAAPA
jgi:hypothetical protein